MGRTAWFRQAPKLKEEGISRGQESASLRKSWTRDVSSPGEREERMRERFRYAIDEGNKQLKRLEPGALGPGGRLSPEFAFFERLNEPKLIEALTQLAREVANANKPIREVFAEFDLDGDGTLDREEMKIGMANFGVSAKIWELDAIMKAFDEDGNGRVDYEEFADMLDRCAEMVKEPEPPPRPKGGFLRRSMSMITDFATGTTGSKAVPKPRAASFRAPVDTAYRMQPASPDLRGPGMNKVGSSPALKRGRTVGSRPDSAGSAGRSTALQAAGSMQMRDHHRSISSPRLVPDLSLSSLELPPMVRQSEIKGKEDLEWLQMMLEQIQKPKLRQALDKLAVQMHEARHSTLTVFKEIDLNGDHMLSREEIGTGLRKLKVSLLPTELDAVMAMFDEDMNGGIDYREFSALLARYARLINPLPHNVRADAIRTINDMNWIETVLARVQTPKLRATLDRLSREIFGSTRSMHSFFVQFDLNGDGVLSAQEMHAGLTKMAGPLQLSEVEAVMIAFDADGNGEVDYREFCSMLARYGRLTLPGDAEKFVPKEELEQDFPVGCRVKALFNLPKASTPEDKIGTVTGVGKRGTLLVQLSSHEPMVVRSVQVKRLDTPDGRCSTRTSTGQDSRSQSHKGSGSSAPDARDDIKHPSMPTVGR